MDIDELINTIYNKKNKIFEYYKKIERTKKEQRLLERTLFKLCQHITILVDINASFDDLCKKYCKRCGLWMDSSLY